MLTIIICINTLCAAGITNIQGWTQGPGTIDIDLEEVLFKSGYSIKYSSNGNTVAIYGKNNEDDYYKAINIRIYEWSGSVWKQKGLNIEIDDLQGIEPYVNLSPDGNSLAIYTSRNDQNKITIVHPIIYEWTEDGWTYHRSNT